MNDAESFVVYGSMGSMEKWRNDDKFAELVSSKCCYCQKLYTYLFSLLISVVFSLFQFKKASELLHLREHKLVIVCFVLLLAYLR